MEDLWYDLEKKPFAKATNAFVIIFAVLVIINSFADLSLSDRIVFGMYVFACIVGIIAALLNTFRFIYETSAIFVDDDKDSSVALESLIWVLFVMCIVLCVSPKNIPMKAISDVISISIIVLCGLRIQTDELYKYQQLEIPYIGDNLDLTKPK